MSKGFLAQLAHRALAGSDVQPRVTARFENIAPQEQERVVESPAPLAERPPAERLPPSRVSEASEPDGRAPPITSLHTTESSTHTVTHTEIVERVSERVDPEMPAPASRAALPGAPQLHPIEGTDRPAPALELPPTMESRATPGLPLLAREHFVSPPAQAREPAADHRRVPEETPPPRVSTSAPPLLSIAPAIPMSPRPPIQPTPAPAPIEIVIGRIEIRSDAAVPASRAPAVPPRRTATSLDDYLRKRDGAA